MVFFTCGNCGESIKKPSIAKHYMSKCRGPVNVTCVDCFKDFFGNEYEAHIKCITEEERYAAKGFVPKPSSNKGEKKQQTWFEAVQNILTTKQDLKKDERELLEILSAHENLPRKKAKFINFLTNAHRAYARKQDLVERVWSIIEEAGKAATAASINGTKTTVTPEQEKCDEKPTNGTSENVPEKKKSKRKSEAASEDSAKKPKIAKSGNIIKDHLQQSDGNLSLYKLIQFLQKHCESEGGEEKAPKLLKKLEKQISVVLNGDRIELNVDKLNK